MGGNRPSWFWLPTGSLRALPTGFPPPSCSYQLEQLLSAKTGIAADPEVMCMLLRTLPDSSGVQGLARAAACVTLPLVGGHVCNHQHTAVHAATQPLLLQHGVAAPTSHHETRPLQPSNAGTLLTTPQSELVWFLLQVRAAAEAALETLSVCVACNQVGWQINCRVLHMYCVQCSALQQQSGMCSQ